MHAQRGATRVTRIEVDEIEVHDEYKVVFDAGNYWIEGKRTETGFVIPDAVSGTEWVNFIFSFGEHKLRFSKVHISKFGTDWIVGVDKWPYSEEYVGRKDAKRTHEAYYIKFQGKGLGTQLVVNSFRRK
jgi:hypothetical protein